MVIPNIRAQIVGDCFVVSLPAMTVFELFGQPRFIAKLPFVLLANPVGGGIFIEKFNRKPEEPRRGEICSPRKVKPAPFFYCQPYLLQAPSSGRLPAGAEVFLNSKTTL